MKSCISYADRQPAVHYGEKSVQKTLDSRSLLECLSRRAESATREKGTAATSGYFASGAVPKGHAQAGAASSWWLEVGVLW